MANKKGNPGNKGNTNAKGQTTTEKEVKEKAVKELGEKLKTFMDHDLDWAIDVIQNDKTITVTKHLKLGGTQTFEMEKYPAEVKLELIKKFADKVFSDKKDINMMDPLAPVPVAFSFKPAPQRRE